MRKSRDYVSSLEVGEVTPDFLRIPDEDERAKACKTALNVILKAGAGATRRPGSQQQAQLVGKSIRYTYRGRTATEALLFSNGRLDIYAADGTLSQTIIDDVPWVLAQLDALRFATNSDKVFVGHQDFMVRELTRNASGTWSLSTFAFTSTVGGRTSQPFYDKFEDIGVTMGIAAYSGSSIAITFSANVLEAAHVGLRFRYLTSCEVEITAVTDGQNGTCTIIDALYPTITVTVASNSGFKVGQVIEGSVSSVRGIIAAVTGSTTLTVLLLEGYDHFEYDSGSADNTDKVVGDESESVLTATPTLVSTPATTSIWDEQLMSDVRGYAGTIAVHKNRLVMSNFKQATDVVVGSSIGNFYDFEVSADDEGAFNEELGADPNSQILHLVSTEQLLLLTDRGIYYVPEAPEAPLTPTNIEFVEAGTDGAADIVPVKATEGVLFIDNDAKRLMVVAQTGNVRKQWNVAELSETFYHMLTGPKRIAIANGLDGRTERYALILNTDGSIACVMYRRGSERVGATRWLHGAGVFDDITAHRDQVFLTSLTGGVYTMSKVGFAHRVDDEVSYASLLTGRDGLTCDVVDSGSVVGTGLVTNGTVAGIGIDNAFTAGFDFDVDVTPAAQVDASGFARQRVTKIWVDVRDTGTFRIDDQVFWPFEADDPLDVPGKTRSTVIEAFMLGWSNEATRSIKQAKGEGAALDIRAITMEVST